ncbi:YeeE/YedE thiosulfate transporter family protein [Desulfosoma caldarium]|uniref:Uncharacterized protein n=1 Tax=Desulfosoma caldarium TaxID=610254 RepID=A0A3N1UQ48_9BACT|nr:YeeE/YedE thiosulfate transporter family protein [Desulfosoma caldarium]ROQ92193.1 hypothetical protein EDC27_1887 [Desulfosoma caldarium]
MNEPKYMNPYLAGVLLGLVLLASYLVLGTGLGASGGVARLGAAISSWVAPEHTRHSAYFGSWGDKPLHYYLVFMMVGTFLGGLFSAMAAGRMGWTVEKGEAFSRNKRLLLALVGGLLVGFASRLARGCTSGQGMTGGALFLNGSWLFLISLFSSGYFTAWLVRRQWHD